MYRKKRLLKTALSGLAMIGLCGPVYASLVTFASSTFDMDLDGWSLSVGHNGTVTHAASGGNPGGYARFTDSGPTGGTLVAPAEFLGDWTSLDEVGLLSWDHLIIDPGQIVEIAPLTASISGPGGSASVVVGMPSTIDWVTSTVPIAESAWILNSGSWDALLANVTFLGLRIEVVNDFYGRDVDGIDNIFLTAVPIPPAIWLLASALCGLLTTARRRNQIS